MQVKVLCAIIALFSCLLVLVSGDQQQTNDDATCDATRNNDGAAADQRRAMMMARQPPCRLYLAESTIPNAGLGLFTAFDMPRGVPIGQPDIVIQGTSLI